MSETIVRARRAYRDPEDRFLGGVASGLASHLGIEPLHARVGFVLLTLMGGLDLSDSPLQRRPERVGCRLIRLEEPGPQLPLLGARELAHRSSIGCLALDQRQGLEHGVVQMRCHVGPLLASHPLPPLATELACQP